MKRILSAALALCLLLLSACGAGEESLSNRAEREFGKIVSQAVKAIERVRRDELSKVTQPFEAEDAYSGEMDIPEGDIEYLDAVGDYIVESMPEGLSAYDQYRYLGYVLSLCAEYDYEVHEDTLNQTPYGALIEGRAICMGYTNTMLWLCEKANLRCSVIRGYASWNGEEHGWNMAYLEDGSYYVDITWCDQHGEPGSEGWNDYFMVTESRLLEDHGIWTGGPATGTVDYS